MQPNAERLQSDLEALSRITDEALPGWSRAAFSEEDSQGRMWVRDQFDQLGLQTHVDGAGNVIGVLEGTRAGRGAIATGSHTDTVVGGGRFDGTVGVVAAMEAVRLLTENNVRLEHDLILIDFFNEEPNPWSTSCLGSRALTGQLPSTYFDRVDDNGLKLADAFSHLGMDPDSVLTANRLLKRTPLKAFIELHIEQGRTLEQSEAQVGLVTSITGVARFEALFRGRRDHAGSASMSDRQDAGCAAAGTILALEEIAQQNSSGRGTAGRLTFTPDSVNVVTEIAELTGELRSPDTAWLQAAREALSHASAKHSKERGVSLELEWLPLQDPVELQGSELFLSVKQAVENTGSSVARLYSAAEHDAAIMAKVAPSAMIFVPSKDGRSHCPEEWTDIEDIAAGTAALVQSIISADRLR